MALLRLLFHIIKDLIFSKRRQKTNSCTIKDIIAMNDNDLFEKVNNFLYYHFEDEDFYLLNKEQKTVLSLINFDNEVQNGGLCQFFVNSSRIFAPCVSQSLEKIGATKINKLFCDFIAKNNINLQELSSFDSENEEEFIGQYERFPFDDFDNSYYELYKNENITELLINYIRNNIESVFEKHTDFETWIEGVMETEFPKEVVAINFNIYDDSDGKWSLEFVGTATFDEEDSDWATDELIATRTHPFVFYNDSSWEEIEKYCIYLLKQYLQNGKYADKLKTFMAIGVGFVDGDITILYKSIKALEKDLATMSGMWALWDYKEYENISSMEEWEKSFLEDSDIEKQIDISKIVPIYIHSDGCFKFRIKINEVLNERENKYILAKSNEYLFKSSGTAILSGIENIEKNISDNECLKATLPKGTYSVVIYLIEWDAEPKMKLKNGNPSPDALPDFIVSINTTSDISKSYRKSIETFETQV